MIWKVKFFQTARGEYPVKAFVEEQDEATYAKALHAIRLLSNNGPFLKTPYIKKIQNKLCELRISGQVAIRIFYTIMDNEYDLLHGFKKKSQKTPPKEIDIAISRMNELIDRTRS